MNRNFSFFLITLLSVTILASCTPTVKVETPEEPIVIDLNINIEHKIKVEIDKELESLMDSEEGIF